MLQKATKLKVDALFSDDMKTALEEAKGMCVKWEGDHKVREESMVCKVEEEEALCKGKEPVHSNGEEEVNNEAACLFDDDVSPVCEEEEEVREPTLVVKLAAKPAPAKQIEFHVMRVTSTTFLSTYRSMCSMEVIIPV